MTNDFDVIASRTIDVVDSDGTRIREVLVHIGRPWQEPRGHWAQPYQIVGLGDGKVRRIFGFDAIQALQDVCLVIGSILAGSDEGQQGRLRWAGESDLGFPVSPPRVDLATEQGASEDPQ